MRFLKCLRMKSNEKMFLKNENCSSSSRNALEKLSSCSRFIMNVWLVC